ncbi:putative integral membrane protein [Acanthocheilonema viteae]
MSFGLIFRNFKTDESYTSTDEENDSNVVYVKVCSFLEEKRLIYILDLQRLLGNAQQRQMIMKQKSSEMTCRDMLLALSFIALGISTSIQSITIPNMIVNTHATSSLFFVFTLCITAFGFLIGCSAVSRLFAWMNPILLLLFSLFGALMITALLGSSKTTLIVYMYSLISGCFHGMIFRGGLIILCGSDFGTRTVFAMHAFFAAGIFLMSLLSTFILSGAAVPYSNFSTLPDGHNVLNHLLIKRKMNLLSAQSGDDIFAKSSALESITSKSLRQPDHVVGVESVAEPKTQENVQKRKEAVGRVKSREEEQSLVTNGALHVNGVGERERNQNKVSHSNTSPAYISISTASFLHLGKNDNGIGRSMDQTETTVISNATSAPPSLIKPNNVTVNFMFNDVSYSFSGLNWNISTITRNSFWILENLEQKFGPFQNVHMMYVVATFLGLCHLLCFVAVVCNGNYFAASSLQIIKLQETPNLFMDWKEMAVSWRAYSVIFFLLTGGIELVVGESLTFYALFRPELSLSQRNGLFLTSIFWLGIVTARVLFMFTTKFININRLSNFVFFSAVVAGYVAASARSLPVMLCTLFILGLSLGPLSPFLFCWLDEHELSSRLSLSLLYAIGISLGRLIFPCIIAFFIYICSTPVVLFAVVCVSLFLAYIVLIMTVRTVRVTVCLSATNHCSGGRSPEVNVIPPGQKIRSGDYIVLVDKSGSKSDVSADSDSLAEDILLG